MPAPTSLLQRLLPALLSQRSARRSRQVRLQTTVPLVNAVIQALNHILDGIRQGAPSATGGVMSEPSRRSWIPIFVDQHLTEANIDHLASQTLVSANNLARTSRRRGRSRRATPPPLRRNTP
jgi:hypothetical protein